ncbi:carbohydrate ABC transporter permease [Jonesiaceae bacterium BS-20]|uniref:Carbohydrate ABC transporter permease n=1 Tax=Jonesiaceae bacterium BS-20 TaxID=3120821 RepID=A0AAU7DR18_9MICO
MTKKLSLGRIMAYIMTFVLVMYCIFPFLWMLISSFKGKGEIRRPNPSFIISQPTLDNFKTVLVDAGFTKYISNSLVVSLSACIISLVISLLAGYAFSRYYRQRAVKVSNLFMLLSQMIPGVLLLIPLYIVMRNLGLLDTKMALIIAYTTFVIPLCTFMLSSGFDNIPKSLEEAAEIDGCSKFGTIWRILIPVMVPTIISVGLYAFINAWNEFMFGYIFITTSSNRTLTPAIMLFKGSNTVDWGAIMAASVVAVIPMAVIFLFLQKYFISGLMSGAVKG